MVLVLDSEENAVEADADRERESRNAGLVYCLATKAAGASLSDENAIVQVALGRERDLVKPTTDELVAAQATACSQEHKIEALERALGGYKNETGRQKGY